jgi:hypothetical protein
MGSAAVGQAHTNGVSKWAPAPSARGLITALLATWSDAGQSSTAA